jgi:hypothetical protein
VKGKTNTRLIVSGVLNARGTSVNPIVFTSYKGWIEFTDTSVDNQNILEYCTILYGGKDNWHYNTNYYYGAVRLISASPTISLCTISNNSNYGVHTTSSTPVLGCNNIYNNGTYGLYNATANVTVTAENQWWGSATGPYHSTNITGTGNAVSNAVDFTPWRVLPCGTLPMTPTNLIATGVSETQIGLTWQDNSSDETEFRIERASTGTTLLWTEIATVTINITTYIDSGFSCSSLVYNYRVRAYRQDDDAYSDYSNVASAATLPCSPSQLTATLTAPTQITLTWQDNSPDESEFHVERSPNGSTGWIEIATVPTNTITYTDTSLSCSTAYYYHVRAHRHSDGLYSGYSNVSSAITAPCSPSSANALAASEIQINLAWQDNSPDESAFLIERSPDGSTSWTQIVTTIANVTNYSDVNLSCSTAYYYQLRAYRQSDGQYSASYSNVAGAVTAPCAPSNLSAITSTLTQIDLRWQDNSPDESAFHIERSPDGNASWTQVGSVGANVTSYSNTGLWCGTTYYYRTRAYRQSDGQSSGCSSTASFTTLPCFKVYLPITLKNYP